MYILYILCIYDYYTIHEWVYLLHIFVHIFYASLCSFVQYVFLYGRCSDCLGYNLFDLDLKPFLTAKKNYR